MNITYSQQTLRIDCNEVGFSDQDVEAICKIGHSSKPGYTNKIGEKGIGFKSVFKVADVVWINSGHYSFKLDNAKKLGMISPEWDSFPGKRLQGFTSFLLQLSQSCDVMSLLREIKAMDPEVLMFLRKLEEVNIKIFEDNVCWKTTLRRRHAIKENNGRETIILRHDETSLSYIIFRHPVLQMPEDQKRKGCNQSEILLAFPSDSDICTKPQSVYAYLPIRDYNFKV
jgi:hypothetical protein